ncbi:MAG: hypothetical protein AAF533_02095 [Acidobacteriota bacterium]
MRVTSRLIVFTVLSSVLLGGSSAPAATDAELRRIGLAHSIAAAAERFSADLAGRHAGTSPRDQDLRQDVLAFAGASRIVADRLSASPSGNHSDLLADLDALAVRAEASYQRAQPRAALPAAWTGIAQDLAQLVSGRGATTRSSSRRGNDMGGRTRPSEPSTGTPPPPPPPDAREPSVDPNAPRIEVELSWRGTFTPDLLIRGFVEGRGLQTGEIIVEAPDGKQLHRKDLTSTMATIARQRDRLGTVDFEERVDDDTLVSGENFVVLRATDSAGRTTEQRKRVVKRLF